jgi:molybdopterin synthase catalytic subunit
VLQVRVQPEDFDLGAEVNAMHTAAAAGTVGAAVAFVGLVRDDPRAGAIHALELEHYPGVTEAAIEAMAREATARFGLAAVRVVHRVGALPRRAQIMMVAVAAAHRGAAFQGAEFLMDYLKTQAPFWKKEHLSDGTAHWVDARAEDDAALARWGVESRNAA